MTHLTLLQLRLVQGVQSALADSHCFPEDFAAKWSRKLERSGGR
jgi:hypothetical protein